MLLLSCLLGLAGCSSTELLYDNADWLAHRWTSSLVDASGAQRDAWREPFAAVMAEHRAEVLPQVVVLLRALEAEIEGGPGADRLSCLVDEADRLYREHARLAVPLAIRVLLDLEIGQLDHMAEELEERNQDYADEYLDPDPARRERLRVERYLERIERWTGELSTAQVRLVEGAIGRMPDIAAPWLDYRRAQQRRLLTLLRTAPTPPQLQRFLYAWWVEFAGRPPALAAQLAQIRRQSVTLALALYAESGPAQRAHLLNEVRGLREDLAGITGARVPLQLVCAERPRAPY
jgi:hypothetical protein